MMEKRSLQLTSILNTELIQRLMYLKHKSDMTSDHWQSTGIQILQVPGVKENGKRAYSSYLALSAPFKLGGLDWTVDLGMVPWETTFYNGYTSGFCVSDVSLGASKDIKITDSFSVPAFAKVSVNPRTEGAYFAFGLSF